MIKCSYSGEVQLCVIIFLFDALRSIKDSVWELKGFSGGKG
jgi:hypothetical protein